MADTSVSNTTAQLSGKTLITAEGDWTITGLHSYSRGASAPFAVNSGAAKVTNLDADLLDGLESAGFFRNGPTVNVADLLFTDATYDIGKTGATRPRDLFASRNVAVGGTLGVTGLSTVVDVTSSGWIQHTGQSRVTSQFDKTTNVTLADVTGLTFAVEAGKTYKFRAVLYCISTTNGGVKFAVAGTATATAIIAEAMAMAGGNFVQNTRVTALGSAMISITATTNPIVIIEGTITVNAAGTLTIQFAQNASHADTSSVRIGSTFEASRMA